MVAEGQDVVFCGAKNWGTEETNKSIQKRLKHYEQNINNLKF